VSAPIKRSAWVSSVVWALSSAGVTLMVERLMLHRHAEGPRGDEHGPTGEHDHEHEKHGGLERVKLTPEGRVNAALRVVEAAGGTVSVTVTLPGEVRLHGERIAHVTPRVGGVAREVRAKLGDAVKRGDVLAVLDSRELTDISREVRAAGERVKLAEANWTRVEKLSKDGILPEKELLAAKQLLAEARIEQESAAQMLASTGSGRGGVYEMIAPIDGTIVEKHATLGEVLKDDAPAFVVADLREVWVDVTVYGKDLAWIAPGLPVRVRAEGLREAASGTIAVLSATASGEARTTTARVVLGNVDGRWKPGLFVSADVAVEEVAARVTVPEEAVQSLDGRTVVFVEEELDTFEARPVTVGHVGFSPGGAERFLEITRGIEPGDRVVASGAFLLKAELGKSAAGHDH
jgi:cobalt-zinc-cadmium efflux system membrane fusion protein